MAEINNKDIGTPSKLSESSVDFRTCSIAKNSPSASNSSWSGYVPGNEYTCGSSYTIADGDNKGRDPEDGDPNSQSIGIPIDIERRNALTAKNNYNQGNVYCGGHSDTIADGDNRGRNPEDGDPNSQSIGIPIDIACRNALMAKNGYNQGNVYCGSHPDTIADGDNKGRDPEDNDINAAGTKIDFSKRRCAVSKNQYKGSREYKEGSCFV